MGMGKAIGINFKGDSHKRFSVLSRWGRKKQSRKIKKGRWENGGRRREFRCAAGGVRVVRVLLMKILSWNVRGLGDVEKRREVRLFVGEKVSFIL